MNKTEPNSSWDDTADLIVVGYGGAGAATALTAHEAGASVILLEKAPRGEEGGNTRVAAQGYLNTSDAAKACDYLNALCGPYAVPQAMVEVWAQEMCRNNDWFASLGGDPQEHQHQPAGIEFPDLPGADCVHKFHHGDILGFSKTWEALAEGVTRRGIDVRYATPATRLVADPARGDVIGVVAQQGGREVRLRARKAVVLTCGGFENNQDMIRNFLPGLPYCYTSGSPYNEGDGIRMAMEIGADLWHMNNYAGPSMALKVPDFPTTLSMRPLHFGHELQGGMIVVGPDGRRFTDEKYKTRHGKIWQSGKWMPLRTPCPMYMIVDHTLLSNEPLYDGSQPSGWTPLMIGYTWSRDNQVELARGWIRGADTLAQLAADLELPVEALAHSVNAWNEHCARGVDTEFGRTKMMNRFDAGPYYAVELSPSMLNTQGGPRRNEKAQVLRPDGSPIGRLYSAGELGSIFSYLYQGTGNIGECFAFGRIAALNAVKEVPLG